MTDKILIEDLANAPPRHWAEMIVRASVLESFTHAKASVAEADIAATSLGIQRRRFYKLLAAHRRRRAGGAPVRSMLGCSYGIEEDQEKAISDALENSGPGARLCDVYRETIRICEASGITPPSKRPVGTRFGKTRPAVSLRERLKTDADIIVDLCRLELILERPDGQKDSAYLLAVIETASGLVLDHHLLTGLPDAQKTLRMVDEFAAGHGSSSPQLRVLEFTSALGAHVPLTTEHLHRNGFQIVGPGGPLAAGAATRVIFGDRVGRVCIRTDRISAPAHLDSPTVPIDMAVHVVNYLVGHRNAELFSH